MMVTIYALLDESGREKYVGRTVHPGARLSAHLSENGSSAKCRWIRSMVSAGLRPSFRVLETTQDEQSAHLIEAQWVSKLANDGCELLNSSCNKFRGTTSFENQGKKKKVHGVVVTTRLTEQLAEQLRERAAAEDRALQSIVMRALALYLSTPVRP